MTICELAIFCAALDIIDTDDTENDGDDQEMMSFSTGWDSNNCIQVEQSKVIHNNATSQLYHESQIINSISHSHQQDTSYKKIDHDNSICHLCHPNKSI